MIRTGDSWSGSPALGFRGMSSPGEGQFSSQRPLVCSWHPELTTIKNIGYRDSAVSCLVPFGMQLELFDVKPI